MLTSPRSGALTLQAGELAGGDRPGEGYLARAGRLIAARHQAEELIRHQYGPLPQDDQDDGDEDRPRAPPRNARSSSGGTIPHGRRRIPNSWPELAPHGRRPALPPWQALPLRACSAWPRE